MFTVQPTIWDGKYFLCHQIKLVMFGISPSIKNWKIINFTKNVVKQCQIIAITKSLLVNSRLMEETVGTLSVP